MKHHVTDETAVSNTSTDLRNQAAYPVQNEAAVACNAGLTKRELFAAMAMQSLISIEVWRLGRDAAMAKRAIEFADALLAALEQDHG